MATPTNPLRNTKFYFIWKNVKNRCLNSKIKYYHRYGGRGITVCEKWLMFKGFKEDMYPSYKEGLSIDRIDNNKGYFKENCRWATNKEQQANTSRSRWIIYQGIKKTLSQWVEYFDLKSSTVRQRYYVYKWNINKCFEYKEVI